jgi:hypothetical protein
LEVYKESCGPALDFGLEQRLKRLDLRLRVTYSSFSLNPQTGQPIIDAVTGKPVPDPAQYLWVETVEGWKHVDTFPMSRGGFGHLNVHYLELNKRTQATHKPEALFRLMKERLEVKQELAKRGHLDWRMQRTKANTKRIGDLVFEGKTGYRQAKPMSYPGQANRATPGNVLSDPKQDGWELE